MGIITIERVLDLEQLAEFALSVSLSLSVYVSVWVVEPARDISVVVSYTRWRKMDRLDLARPPRRCNISTSLLVVTFSRQPAAGLQASRHTAIITGPLPAAASCSIVLTALCCRCSVNVCQCLKNFVVDL